jgi:hypothetical protein
MAAQKHSRETKGDVKSIPASQITGGLPIAEERVRARAYEMYEARVFSRTPGDAMSDWLDAERELRDRHQVLRT